MVTVRSKMISFVILVISIFNYGEALFDTPLTQKLRSDMEQMHRNTMTTLGNVFESASPCKCTESRCSCEFTFFIDNPFQKHQGELSLEYDADAGLTASLKAGEVEKRETVDVQQGATLPPLCVPLPQFPVLQFCATFYDVKLNQNTGVHVCLNLEAQATIGLQSTTLASVSFDCLTVGPKQISLQSPDATRPSFINLSVGKNPKITFFNSVSVGVIPTTEAPPFIGETPLNFNFNLKPLKFN